MGTQNKGYFYKLKKTKFLFQEEHFFIINRPYQKGVGIFLNSFKSVKEFNAICKKQYFQNDSNEGAKKLELDNTGKNGAYLTHSGLQFFNETRFKFEPKGCMKPH